MSSICVTPERAANLYAIAQRGAFAGVAQLVLQARAVHFDDDAVNFVSQVVTLGFPLVNEGQDFIEVMDQAMIGIDFETCGFERLQGFRVPLKDGASLGEQRVREKIEPALRGDVRLQHSYRAGRGIARIGELRQSLLFALVVHALKSGQRHQQFSAHFEVGRQAGLSQCLGRNGERYAAHRAHIESHIFAYRAVAAGDAQRQLAGGKAQGQRHAIELQLADVVHPRLAA